MPLYYCVAERKPCLRWVDKYFKDCLCNLRDDLSFGFGLVSLVCWGVADILQLITNFQTKSSHTAIVSLAFLLTWAAGILVRTTEWDKIKANMPWLLDAVVGVALDLFIILQYMYYRHLRKMTTSGDEEEDCEYYKEQDKAVGS